MFSVDGIAWDIPCSITRNADVQASDISGFMLDGSYFNDVMGTYMSYTVKLAVPVNMTAKYNKLYEKLTEAVDGHEFVFPYNSSTIQMTGRVEGLSDVYVRMPNNGIHWRGIQFTAIANHPTKQQTLAGAISRGITAGPYPEVVEDGDTYTYSKNAGGWVPVPQYEDADSTEY